MQDSEKFEGLKRNLVEENERRREIQEQGKRLKEIYQKTANYKDYKAWKNWCDQYNGGRRN